MAETEVKKLRVALTGQPAVRINPVEWPQIAMAEWEDNYPNTPNRTAEVRVRQHSDGRTLVYGSTWSAWANERDSRAGELVEPGCSIPGAINRVCEAICYVDLAQDCIEDLPEVEL